MNAQDESAQDEGWDDTEIDPSVSCAACDAVCCRLTVVVLPGDRVPDRFVTRDPKGLPVLARGADGWCAALDREYMCCSIYAQRPAICRKFAMGSAYCRAERESYAKGRDALQVRVID